MQTNYVRYIGRAILRVLEAPLADIESVNFSAHELFRVERRVPGIELDVSEHDLFDVTVCRLLAITLYG